MIPMKFVFGIAVVIAAVFAAWQILAPEVSNVIFQDELHDMGVQLGSQIGMANPHSEEDMRNLVIAKAARYDIALTPKQVTVRRTGTTAWPTFFLGVDYTVQVDLIVYKFPLHFHPTSVGNRF